LFYSIVAHFHHHHHYDVVTRD